MQIKKLKERWFDYPNDPDGARFLIRLLPPGEIEENRYSVMSLITDFSSTTENAIIKPEISGQSLSSFMKQRRRKSLKAWENVKDEDGKELKFSKEAADRICNEVDGFNEFLDASYAELETEKLKADEAAEKNSSASQPG